MGGGDRILRGHPGQHPRQLLLQLFLPHELAGRPAGCGCGTVRQRANRPNPLQKSGADHVLGTRHPVIQRNLTGSASSCCESPSTANVGKDPGVVQPSVVYLSASAQTPIHHATSALNNMLAFFSICRIYLLQLSVFEVYCVTIECIKNCLYICILSHG